jgi:hypothetical protein
MLRSAPLPSSPNIARLLFLGAFALFSACVPVLGIEEPELAPDKPCEQFICDDDGCGYQPTALGTMCDEKKACDGVGQCKGDTGAMCAVSTDCVSTICDTTCKLNIGSPCEDHFYCFSNICQDFVCKYSDGSGCDTDAECASGVCGDGTCKRSNGNDCTTPDECASGMCTDFVCGP